MMTDPDPVLSSPAACATFTALQEANRELQRLSEVTSAAHREWLAARDRFDAQRKDVIALEQRLLREAGGVAPDGG
jgi:hypothetical protein